MRMNLYFVCTTKFNSSPSFLLELLTRLTKLIRDFCGTLSEEIVRRNFTLIYEILNEAMDFGYVQNTSTNLLRPFIHNEAVIVETASLPSALLSKLPAEKKTQPSTAANKPVISMTAKNEIFVDLLERISVLFGDNGEVLHSELDGSIQMKSFLSGNPELRLGLNEDLAVGRGDQHSPGALVLDDCNFHQCVRLDEFDANRVIVINPIPIGEFTVMNYRVMQDFRIPFRFIAYIDEVASHKLEILIKVRAEIPEERYAGNVQLRLPLPPCTTGVLMELSPGATDQEREYRESDKTVFWTIKRFNGGHEWQMLVKASLDSPVSPFVRKQVGPVSLDFEIPMYSCSNINVRFLHITESSKTYNPNRWVRCLTQANSYECRLG
eukprot:gnl/Trimastix_PCT/2560.p1 GENE.gnl/Trimastix_PCT/2560~~gnl/Trimastix_PCT/2560.p1  ORF type:complete len:380 (+),score=123.90 gnl/Trimastix_PCT/2560:268-1407(+)